ncbi:hypothetical protein [Bacillus atrophaeus]|uniref:hypothetical protein n=1 Tax=Bacillus atrophaeus TaxID=1452 RepID=UPI002E251FAD|nr:hypothetical protein [Bacillus atrophaeus]
MSVFSPYYSGHSYNARKALVKLGLATEEEAKTISNRSVEDLINQSDHLSFYDGEDYAIVPKELKDKIVWIRR